MITEEGLFELSKTLLGQMITEGNIWPCANISLSVGGFEDSVVGNHLISQFLVKGNEAKASKEPVRESASDRPAKKRRIEDNGIYKFFTKKGDLDEHEDDTGDLASDPMDDNGGPEDNDVPLVPQPAAFTCERCLKHFHTEYEFHSHGDWHFAKDLQDEDRNQSTTALRSNQSQKPKKSSGLTGTTKKSVAASGDKKVEKGQRKLNFGL